MSAVSTIEWTRSSEGTHGATWNPVTGCTKLSPGCEHCYAATFAERWRGTPGHPYEQGFDLRLWPDRLELPLRWGYPRRVFVNSMSDLFHPAVPDAFIAKVFAVMALAPRHTFLVLTKRHGRMRSLLSNSIPIGQPDPGPGHPLFTERMLDAACEMWQNRRPGCPWPANATPLLHTWPLPNVWLGVSAEDHQRAALRIPALLGTPAVVRFVSAEPLLGPINLTSLTVRGWRYNALTGAATPPPGLPEPDQVTRTYDRLAGPAPRLDWVIAGGESGPRARPMHPAWARSLRDQATTAGTAFFFKQWGAWTPDPATPARTITLLDPRGGRWDHQPQHAPPGTTTMRRAGKHRTGRLLDGHAWDQAPAA